MIEDVTALPEEPIADAPETLRPELTETLIRRMRELRATARTGLAQNPVLALAVETSQRIAAGTLGPGDLTLAAQTLMDRAAERRARRLARRTRFGFADPLADLERLIRTSAGPQPSWERFAEIWARPAAGVVFTAHPTFAMSRALSRAVVTAAQARGGPGSQAGLSAEHRGEATITLEDEHRAGSEALGAFHEAYRRLATRFYDVTAELFPHRWRQIRPGLATAASWIGYDLDGRTDIAWTDTFRFRLAEKAATLSWLADRLTEIAQGSAPADPELTEAADTLRFAAERADAQCRAIVDAGADGPALVAAANAITRNDAAKMTSLQPLVETLTRIAALAEPRLARELLVLATMADRFGPCGRHMHMRVNAKQLHNAFQAHIGEPWARNLRDRSALTRLAELIAAVRPESVNFGSLITEPTTAIRQFAAAAQILKHVDAASPIRFLIAECEDPVTILIAIYFAKLMGVDHRLDISPLFETPEGLDHGAGMMDRLFAEPAYAAYVENRGRISIQTGFSDAGRFIGQIPAVLAIEALQLRIAETAAARGLGHLELLIFNTHGESMGRGHHPGGLDKRFRYILSDRARAAHADRLIRLKHEISFQGGDGFVYFGSPALATQTLAAFVMDAMRTGPFEVEDPLYTAHDLRSDVIQRMRDFHRRLYDNEGYRALLASLGPNLLIRTGSRAVKRALAFGAAADRDPARMRAIPNNAILQQVGFLSNVVGGIGSAAGAEPDAFVDLARRSPRLQLLLEMVATAKKLSSINALTAYAALLDPGFWASLAYVAAAGQPMPAYERLARQLLTDDRSCEIGRFAQFLRLDALRLHRVFEKLGIDGGQEPDADRLELDALHAIRVALIIQLFMKAAEVPDFANRNDVSHAQFMAAALSLEIDESVSFLRRAFPRGAGGVEGVLEERASYRPFGQGGYERLERQIFEPMLATYRQIQSIGVGIAHHFDAYG